MLLNDILRPAQSSPTFRACYEIQPLFVRPSVSPSPLITELEILTAMKVMS
jgi:hypothetical protein